MDIKEAINQRHSVRQFQDKPLEPEAVNRLNELIENCNTESGLHFQLVLNEPDAFNTFMAHYGKFTNAVNYIALVGKKDLPDLDEKCGYFGERIVLEAQMIGLNTCWVGLTYKKIPGTFTLRDTDTVHCVIALGYGTIPGVQHPQKPAENFYEADGIPPRWFLDGMEAALLAPTAINQQKFRLILREGNKVETKTLFSMAGYTNIDLGIAKYHFEVAAGKENFSWL